jgi:hypothetical protein
MDRILNATDLTQDELMALRLIVSHNFMSKASLSAAQRDRLVDLGLIRSFMGGVSPTPAGRICARG